MIKGTCKRLTNEALRLRNLLLEIASHRSHLQKPVGLRVDFRLTFHNHLYKMEKYPILANSYTNPFDLKDDCGSLLCYF